MATKTATLIPMMQTDESIIAQTTKWIKEVVVGCNFCPFAGNELKRGSIHYQVVRSGDMKKCLQELALELQRLDSNENIETTLIIFPDDFTDFYDYLELTELAEKLLADLRKEGIYQVATFHPLYLFAGSAANDPANYTNRSIFPMLQLLREASVTAALEQFPHPERIPQNNISFAKKKGLEYMKVLRDSCKNEA